MKTASLLCRSFLFVGVLSLILGCDGQEKKSKALLGTWTTLPTPTEWGLLEFEISFQTNQMIEARLVLPDDRENTPANSRITGEYRLVRGQLITDVINKGNPVSIWLEGTNLFLQIPSEPPVRYFRK
jgi:hypothetical protein